MRQRKQPATPVLKQSGDIVDIGDLSPDTYYALYSDVSPPGSPDSPFTGAPMTYNPFLAKKSSKPLQPKAILAMRTSNQKEVEKKPSQYTPIRMSAIAQRGFYERNGLSPISTKEKLQDAWQTRDEHFVAIKSIDSYIERSDGSLVPYQLTDEAGKSLHLTNVMGDLLIYSNLPESYKTPQKKLIDLEKFKQSEIYDEVVTPNKKRNYKERHLHITHELLEKTKQKIAKQGGKRLTQQNTVMGDSANSYYDASDVATHPEKFSKEWCHLIAYFIWGEKSQFADNMLAGSEHGNTLMMFIEMMLPALAKSYPDGIDINVIGWQMPGSHIATIMHYTVEAKSQWKVAFEMNMQLETKPNINILNYVEGMFSVLHQQKKAIKSPTNKHIKRSLFDAKKDPTDKTSPPGKSHGKNFK